MLNSAEIKPPKITIEDGYGEFSILIDKDRFYFSQEEDYKGLIKVFEKLGFKAKYKEVY